MMHHCKVISKKRRLSGLAHGHPVLEPELIGNQRNKLRIGGLPLAGIDGVAEERIQRIQIAPVPGDLDGVADCTPHPG